MYRTTVLFVWTAIVTILGPPSSAQKAKESPVLVLMETRDAPGTVDPEKLEQCLHLTLREMSLDKRELPRIAVYHVSQKTADYLGVDTNSIWRANGGGHPRYEMWIVGTPTNSLYSYMMERILQMHFQVAMDERQRSRILEDVERGLNATVDVRSFR